MSNDLQDLERNNTKKQLVDIIRQLRDKIEELQGVEAKQEASESSLNGKGFSIIQDLDSSFKIVEISFDIATKVGKIDNVKPIETNSYDLALYEAKKYLVQTIMDKKNLNHLKEK
jgi:hypothetical protein